MEYQTYKEILAYHKSNPRGREVLPPNLNIAQRKAFPRKASKFAFRRQKLYRDGKVVLQDRNVDSTLKDKRGTRGHFESSRRLSPTGTGIPHQVPYGVLAPTLSGPLH